MWKRVKAISTFLCLNESSIVFYRGLISPSHNKTFDIISMDYCCKLMEENYVPSLPTDIDWPLIPSRLKQKQITAIKLLFPEKVSLNYYVCSAIAMSWLTFLLAI